MDAKKPLDDATRRLIERLNQIIISREDILELVQELALQERKDGSWERSLMTVIHLQNGDADKVQAITFRMEALALLLENEDTSGWTIRLPNGAVLAQEPVFAAAAVEILIEQDGNVLFDRDSFLQKVLELSDLETIG